MSPVPKSRSKDKSSLKAVKEQQQKASSKHLTAQTASAYNPISGTFHSVETVPPAPSPAPQNNSRLRTIDEQSGSSNGTLEYDSMSNNGSCSGESEDQKEKSLATATPRLEAIPGSDTDKREKIRQKNERKHQRQKERRAQELHERCSRSLMSRKLETMSQQLVAMGFSSERAIMALTLNGGRVEEAVAWLLEGGEDGGQLTDFDAESNLKIDISGELAKIVEMEVKFQCAKQDVERAIVACEGDMDKVAETLKAQKLEQLACPLKSEVAGEASAAHQLKVVMAAQSTITRTQVKAVNSATPLQQKGEESDFNYMKAAVLSGTVAPDTFGNRNLQPLKQPQPKAEWMRLQEATILEKRWPNASASSSASYSLTSPLQVAVPAVKAEARYNMAGSEGKMNLQTGCLRESVVMQRPQSGVKQIPLSTCVAGLTIPPAVTSGWYPNGVSNVEMMKATTGGLGPNLQTMSLSTSSPSPTLPHQQNQYQHFIPSSVDYAASGLGGSWIAGTSLGTASSSSSLAVPSSLGLFTGWGLSKSSSSSSPVDWSSTGSLMMQCDYASIDWSLDSTPLRANLDSTVTNDLLYDAWATTFMGEKLGRQGINGGVCIAGLQDSGNAIDLCASAGSYEWTSPFAGKDLFSLSRQFVTPPYL